MLSLDCRFRERPCYLFDGVALNHIVYLDVVEVCDGDAALETLTDLSDVVLKAPPWLASSSARRRAEEEGGGCA